MKNEIAIKSIRNRPRFKINTQMQPEVFTSKIRKHLESRSEVLTGTVHSEEAIIRLRKDDDKYWAPQLQIRIEKSSEKEKGFEIRGVFGPTPSVWTFFLFLYGMGGGIILTVGIYGWVELALGIGQLWVWSNLIGLLLIVFSFLAAQIGQSLSKEHLTVLRDFIERVMVDENIID